MRYAFITLVVGIAAAPGLGCQDESSGEDAVRYGEPVAAPVDQQITILPTAVESPESFRHIDPIAIGFELDAIIHSDGELGDYRLRGEEFEAAILLTFASEEFFSPAHDDEQERQSCQAFGWWSPLHPAELESIDDAIFIRDYEGILSIDGHDCHDLLNPAKHGAQGADFINQFDGMQLGIGLGEITEELLDGWPESITDTWGRAMLGTYFAIRGTNGEFIAQDISTTFAMAVNEGTHDVLTDEEGAFIPLDVGSWDPAVAPPRFFAYTIATWFLTLESLDLSALKP